MQALLANCPDSREKKLGLLTSVRRSEGFVGDLNQNSLEGEVVVVVHFFYLDNLSWQVQMLSQLEPEVKIFITTSTLSHKVKIEEAFEARGIDVRVQVVENRGRNFAGMLGTFLDDLEKFDFIIALHNKKSPSSLCGRGKRWNRGLWEDLVGSRAKLASLVDLMKKDVTLKLVTSHKHGLPSKINQKLGINAQQVNGLAEVALPFGRMSACQRVVFPAGGMFIVRASVLTQVAALFGDRNFPEEPLDSDGTTLHALERLFGLLPMISGGSLGFVRHEKRFVSLVTVRFD